MDKQTNTQPLLSLNKGLLQKEQDQNELFHAEVIRSTAVTAAISAAMVTLPVLVIAFAPATPQIDFLFLRSRLIV